MSDSARVRAVGQRWHVSAWVWASGDSRGLGQIYGRMITSDLQIARDTAGHYGEFVNVASQLPLGQWHRVAFVLDPTEVENVDSLDVIFCIRNWASGRLLIGPVVMRPAYQQGLLPAWQIGRDGVDGQDADAADIDLDPLWTAISERATRTSVSELSGRVETAEAKASSTADALANLVQVDTTAGTKVTVAGQVIHYDSGWRVLGSDRTPGVVSGRVLVRRTLDQLEMRFEDAVMEAGSGTLIVVSSMPTGWGISGDRNARYVGRADTAYQEQALMVRGTVVWMSEYDRRSSTGASQVRPTQGLDGAIAVPLRLNEPLPTTLIGTPA